MIFKLIIDSNLVINHLYKKKFLAGVFDFVYFTSLYSVINVVYSALKHLGLLATEIVVIGRCAGH